MSSYERRLKVCWERGGRAADAGVVEFVAQSPLAAAKIGGVAGSGGFHMAGGTPIARWFIRENAIKMDDLQVPLFQDPPWQKEVCSTLQGPFPDVSRKFGKGNGSESSCRGSMTELGIWPTQRD